MERAAPAGEVEILIVTSPLSTVQTIDGLPDPLHVPLELLRLRGVRRDPLLAYAVLWAAAGYRPARLTVDYLRLQGTLAASDAGVRRWLATLERLGLVDVLHRGPRQAEIRVRDWRDPRRADELVSRGPAQLALPGMEWDTVDAEPPTIPIWQTPHTARRPHDRPTAG
jgi:hypothetical protein